jgi:hypothetical protein
VGLVFVRAKMGERVCLKGRSAGEGDLTVRRDSCPRRPFLRFFEQ